MSPASTEPSALRASCAEAMGTFVLVFAGTGAVVVDSTSHGAVTHVGVALVLGLLMLGLLMLALVSARSPDCCGPKTVTT